MTIAFLLNTWLQCACFRLLSRLLVPFVRHQHHSFPVNFFLLVRSWLICYYNIYSPGSPLDCAISCLQNADLGSCSATDNVCLCNNQPFIDSTTACIENACSGDDLANAEAFAVAICESVVRRFPYIPCMMALTNVDRG